MKKFIILLLIIILGRTSSFSQNTLEVIRQDSIVSITSSQLKETNIIFAEHSYLIREVGLLRNQVGNYKKLTSTLESQDSLRSQQISSYIKLKELDANTIKSLEDALKKERNNRFVWQIGGVTVSVGLLILLILK